MRSGPAAEATSLVGAHHQRHADKTNTTQIGSRSKPGQVAGHTAAQRQQYIIPVKRLLGIYSLLADTEEDCAKNVGISVLISNLAAKIKLI